MPGESHKSDVLIALAGESAAWTFLQPSTIATRNELVPTMLPATGRQDSSVEAVGFHVADDVNGLAGLGGAAGTSGICKP